MTVCLMYTTVNTEKRVTLLIMMHLHKDKTFTYEAQKNNPKPGIKKKCREERYSDGTCHAPEVNISLD